MFAPFIEAKPGWIRTGTKPKRRLVWSGQRRWSHEGAAKSIRPVETREGVEMAFFHLNKSYWSNATCARVLWMVYLLPAASTKTGVHSDASVFFSFGVDGFDHLVSTFLKRVFFGFFSNQYYCLPVQRILGINEWIVLKSNLTKTCSLLVSSRSRALHRLWVFQLQLPGLRHWKPLQRICRFVDALGGSVQQSPEVVSQRRGLFPVWSGMAELDYGLYPSREMQMVWLKEYLMAYKLFTKKSEEVSPRELETLYVQVNKFALVRDTRASC